jgi:type IV pilus assembly protein PilA
MKKIQKGFTLIELMIVVAIIGILAAVAIPAYQDYIVKAKLSKVQSTIHPVETALAMYYQENGGFITTDKSTSTTAPAVFWTSLGLPTGVTMPPEVDATAFVVDGTVGSGDIVDMTLKLKAIKAVGIDGLNLVLRGQASGTAITWTCQATSTITDTLAKKYFGCP